MHLCPECRALMWGENCVNPECGQHCNTADRLIAEMTKAVNNDSKPANAYFTERRKEV
jgi:hypothetical protein